MLWRHSTVRKSWKVISKIVKNLNFWIYRKMNQNCHFWPPWPHFGGPELNDEKWKNRLLIMKNNLQPTLYWSPTSKNGSKIAIYAHFYAEIFFRHTVTRTVGVLIIATKIEILRNFYFQMQNSRNYTILGTILIILKNIDLIKIHKTYNYNFLWKLIDFEFQSI